MESFLVHINFVIKILINLNYYYEKVFIPMNTWIARKDLMKHRYQIKNFFTVNYIKKDIPNEECAHAKKIWKVFKIKNLGEYHDLYVQSDTLLLADVFENLQINP